MKIKEILKDYRKAKIPYEYYYMLRLVWNEVRTVPDTPTTVYAIFKGVSLVHIAGTPEEAERALESLSDPLTGRIVEWVVEDFPPITE